MAGMIGSIAGLGMQGYGLMQQRSQQKRQQALAQQALGISQDIAKVNRNQAELEFKRRNWEIFRDQQRARSEALATTVNQGAAGRGSSALGGAYGQIGGQVSGALQSNRQAWESYTQLYSLYNDLARVQAAAGQAPTGSAMPGFAAFAGQLPRVFQAFGQLGMLGSNQQ
jgi:hypothetical protein